MNGYKKTLALSKRNLKEILRDPLSVIFAFIMPEAMLILFYFAFHNLTSQFEMKYLCPGVIVFAQSFLTLFIGLLISGDRDGSYITRLYVSGAKASEFIAGYALAVYPIAAIQSILIFLTGAVIDSGIFSVYMLLGFVFSMLSATLFIGFGMLFGSLFGVKSVGGASSVVITGQSILSGMWFPTEGLPAGFTAFMKAFPFKNATSLVTGAIDGFNFADGFTLPLFMVIGYTFAVVLLAVLAFKKQMRK